MEYWENGLAGGGGGIALHGPICSGVTHKFLMRLQFQDSIPLYFFKVTGDYFSGDGKVSIDIG